MAQTRECDMCHRKITDDNPVVLKLFLVPTQGKKWTDRQYTHHLDVGQCCIVKVRNMDWQKRVSKKEEGAKKRLRAAS
jgi:hypothetical protein